MTTDCEFPGSHPTADDIVSAITVLLNHERMVHVTEAEKALKHFDRACECAPESGCFKAQAQAVIAAVWPHVVPARLYFEAHVTIDPVFDERRAEAERIASLNGFRMAKLIMRKREGDAEVPHEDDAFMTGRDIFWRSIRNRTHDVVVALQHSGFHVRRYKIEDTLLDSQKGDVFGLFGVNG